MEWSWTTWAVSVGAVLLSGWAAWKADLWRRGPELDIGFLEHGGMWGDLLLLPIANAVIVPAIEPGGWLLIPIVVGAIVSLWLHAYWYRGGGDGFWREHLWPRRRHGTWPRDLSAAGWLHVVYVCGELVVLLAYAVSPTPRTVVLVVSAVLTLHVPLGLLAPARVATGLWLIRSPLLTPALIAVWGIAAVKLLTA